jgi:heptaprenyl diphosphate synthase
MKTIDTKKITACGIALALSLILSLIENAMPPMIAVLPYAKIGFSNIVIMFMFVTMKPQYGFSVLLIKCVLSSIFAGAPTMMMYSIPASVISFTVVWLLLKTKIFSVVAVSSVGAVIHNTVQIFVGMIVAGGTIASLLPYMMLAGGLAGLATGIIVFFV